VECLADLVRSIGFSRSDFGTPHRLVLVVRSASATAKAKTEYQNFLTLWKDGDPDVPILKQGKAEYAKCALSSALSGRVQVPLAPK
jgi:hypothetical protein